MSVVMELEYLKNSSIKPRFSFSKRVSDSDGVWRLFAEFITYYSEEQHSALNPLAGTLHKIYIKLSLGYKKTGEEVRLMQLHSQA
jgi:hypothetical protein